MEKSMLDTLKKKGKAKNSPDSDFDSEELKMGVEVETEHVKDKKIAKEIAKDHLVEFPDYYTRLKKMEDEAKKETKKSRNIMSEILKGRKPSPEGAISPGGRYKKIKGKWIPIKKDGNRKREVPDSFKAATVVAFLNSRRVGKIKEAKKIYNDLKKMIGEKGIKDFIMKFGDPDKAGNYQSIVNAWGKEAERLKQEGKARVSIKAYTHKQTARKDVEGYLIYGTDSYGRKTKIFTPDKDKAERIKQAVKEGKRDEIDKILLDKKSNLSPKTTVKGTSYWNDFSSARDYAKEHNLPTDRIIEYDKGWAIQKEKGGTYWDVEKGTWGSGRREKKDVKKSMEGTGVSLYKVKVMNPFEMAKTLSEKQNDQENIKIYKEINIMDELSKGRKPVAEGTISRGGKYKKVKGVWVPIKHGDKRYEHGDTRPSGSEIGMKEPIHERKHEKLLMRWVHAKTMEEAKKHVLADYKQSREEGIGGGKAFLKEWESAVVTNIMGMRRKRSGEAKPRRIFNEAKAKKLASAVRKDIVSFWINQHESKPYKKSGGRIKLVLGKKTVLEELAKAVPTVVRMKIKKEVDQQKVPAEVKKYVKSIEDSFDVLNSAVKDLIESEGIEVCSEILKSYVDFKKSFVWRINDAINYPRSIGGMAINETAVKDESRVKESRVKEFKL